MIALFAEFTFFSHVGEMPAPLDTVEVLALNENSLAWGCGLNEASERPRIIGRGFLRPNRERFGNRRGPRWGRHR